ncbi:OsmC family protein [Leucobacter sp. HY1910]
MTTATSRQASADKELIEQTAAAVAGNRSLGNVTFKVNAQSTGGLSAAVHTGSLVQAGTPDVAREGKFTLTSDEPVSLMGNDTGVSPAEYILTGLAGCYTVTLASLAAMRGITLDSVSMSLDFDIDLGGFLGIDADVRKGAKGISVDVDIESPDATREQLEELVRALEDTSPIRDTIANPVPVSTTLR